MNATSAMSDLLTVHEVAHRLALSTRTVQRLCRAGILPTLRLGAGRQTYRIPASALAALLAEAGCES